MTSLEGFPHPKPSSYQRPILIRSNFESTMEHAALKGQDHEYERPHGRAEGSSSGPEGVHHRYAGLPFGNPKLFVHPLSPLPKLDVCSVLPYCSAGRGGNQLAHPYTSHPRSPARVRGRLGCCHQNRYACLPAKPLTLTNCPLSLQPDRPAPNPLATAPSLRRMPIRSGRRSGRRT